MEHGARLSTSRVMAIAFIFMSVLIVLSLSVNGCAVCSPDRLAAVCPKKG